MRYAHLLKRAKHKGYPSQYVALALEVQWVPEPGPAQQERAHLVRWAVCGASGRAGVYGRAVERSGTTAEQFWTEVHHAVRQRGPMWIIAEDAALALSLLGVWALLERGALRWAHTDSVPGAGVPRDAWRRHTGACLIESVPLVLDVRGPHRGARIRWVDARNWAIPTMPPGVSGAERAGRMHSTMRRMVGLLQSEGLGGLRATVAAQAWAGWRYAHLTHPVVCHDHAGVIALEEEGYYGGRCEAYRLGAVAGRVHHLDVGAQYGALCVGAMLPVGLAGTGVGAASCPAHAASGERGVLARVTIRSTARAYPYRPVGGGITSWPVGRWVTTLAGAELHHAQSEGAVERVHEWAVYDLAPALASVAAHYLRLRAQLAGDADLSGWAKMLANALVGKLGARDRQWVDGWSDYPGEAWCSWWASPVPDQWERWRRVAGRDQRQVTTGFAADAVPAMPAWITALGRMQLYRLIQIAGWDHVVYVDTDALMVTEHGYRALHAAGEVAPGTPGRLRLKEVWDALYLHGLRDYDGRRAGEPEGVPTKESDLGPQRQDIRAQDGPLAHLRAGRAPSPLRHTLAGERSGLYRHGTRQLDGSVAPLEMWEG